jgi:hypothetical protein
VSSEFATRIPERVARLRQPTARRPLRVLALQLLGPLTVLGGLVWAIAQPYRIAFLHPDGKGVYEYVAQPPLLVVLVGLLYATLIAPGLVSDLEKQGQREDGPTG